MRKKYQIFISSTYLDLTEERSRIIDYIHKIHHIPAGMELFNAANEDQWSLIARTIDESDYYIVLVKERYGSIFEHGDNKGISFTEHEYEYARKKGKPIFAFVIEEKIETRTEYIEHSSSSKKRLKSFKERIKREVYYAKWKKCEDLILSVGACLQDNLGQHNAGGWVRAEAFLPLLHIDTTMDLGITGETIEGELQKKDYEEERWVIKISKKTSSRSMGEKRPSDSDIRSGNIFLVQCFKIDVLNSQNKWLISRIVEEGLDLFYVANRIKMQNEMDTYKDIETLEAYLLDYNPKLLDAFMNIDRDMENVRIEY